MASEADAAEVMEGLKDLNLSKDEVKRLSTAMKDPQFKSMFMDYAKEISTPSNKEALEKHIQQCEERSKGGKLKEFSMEGKELLIPYSDFCIKTSNKKTGQKIFINLCHCEKVANPIAIDDPFRHGTQWEIPYTLGPPSKEKDKAGKNCDVYDFIVGTEAHQNAFDNKRFKQFLILTAIEAIEKQRNIELDRKFTLPLLKYKGRNGSKETRMFTITKQPQQEVKTGKEVTMSPRSRSPFKFDNQKKDVKFVDDKIYKDIGAQEVTGVGVKPVDNVSNIGIEAEDVANVYAQGWDDEVEPKYEMVYRNNVNYGEFWEDCKLNPEDPTPKEILVRIPLPNVMNATDILVDLEERQVMLRVPGKYRFKANLRYTVDESRGRAQWNKQKHQLNIILPVVVTAEEVDKEGALAK